MSSPYLAWAVIFIIVPIGMIFYYGLTDNTGAFSFANIAAITQPEHIKSLVLALELLNTALEAAADVITKERNRYIKIMKDAAAGAVLIAAMASVAVLTLSKLVSFLGGNTSNERLILSCFRMLTIFIISPWAGRTGSLSLCKYFNICINI